MSNKKTEKKERNKICYSSHQPKSSKSNNIDWTQVKSRIFFNNSG